ncbi:hypothetical protein BIT28_15850 [Photobacterium proteolyticum]|uniref:Peptidase C39-like domain-containing protein n=1 Tax=Photobacterium proteolyticum TaxID=1903952 RepID=A0A1Q9GZ59_9GAMM|nr:hypothetical protein [Photobacterium proteolyticum]OLQ80546.1 hypothetical protein BIT28_15850 [Photobacterium proteolyticum]
MNKFPNLRQPKGSAYCGPYCIVACLYALKLLPHVLLTEINKYNFKEKNFNGELVDLTSAYNLNELALKIYSVTGILSEGKDPAYIDGSGSNSLAAVLYVLNKLGLKTEVVIADSTHYTYLQTLFPFEFELLNQLKAPITVLNDQPAMLGGQLLISVIAFPDSLHFVANNDKGEWFDSELNDHQLNWDAIEQWDTSSNKREKATWLGISIRVSI